MPNPVYNWLRSTQRVLDRASHYLHNTDEPILYSRLFKLGHRIKAFGDVGLQLPRDRKVIEHLKLLSGISSTLKTVADNHRFRHFPIFEFDDEIPF